MFEEVPRRRRGLAGFSARRVALGPFVVGGSVVLAAVGGSVAVAATVITATTIRANDVAPHLPTVVPVSASATSSAPARPSSATSTPSSPASVPVHRSSATASGSRTLTVVAPPPAITMSLPVTSTSASVSATPPSTSASASGSAPASPSASLSSSAPPLPTGNALIYVTAFDGASDKVSYEFAELGSDGLYGVSQPDVFGAVLAPAAAIRSAGGLCPTAGSTCSIADLQAAAANGFYAEAAIDTQGRLASITEIDTSPSTAVGTSAAPTTPVPTSPAPSATPASSPTTTTTP